MDSPKWQNPNFQHQNTKTPDPQTKNSISEMWQMYIVDFRSVRTSYEWKLARTKVVVGFIKDLKTSKSLVLYNSFYLIDSLLTFW